MELIQLVTNFVCKLHFKIFRLVATSSVWVLILWHFERHVALFLRYILCGNQLRNFSMVDCCWWAKWWQINKEVCSKIFWYIQFLTSVYVTEDCNFILWSTNHNVSYWSILSLSWMTLIIVNESRKTIFCKVSWSSWLIFPQVKNRS